MGWFFNFDKKLSEPIDLGLLKNELRRDEGVRNLPYVDTVGKTTIGVGRNLTDVGLSEDEINLLLTNDINRAIKDLDTNLPWWKDLTSNRKRALINLTFNLGINGLLKFTNTLVFIQNGQYTEASVALLQSKYATQVGQRAVRVAQLLKDG